MQLKRKTKRFAALVLAMSMALGCMPVGAWAEATTPTDLPPIIATDGEAVPEPALPSDEQEAEKTDGAPAPEDLEDPDESHGDSEPAADDPAFEQGKSADDNTDGVPADNPQGDDAQDAIPDEPADGSEEENEDNTPDGEIVPDDRLPIQAALDEHGHVYVAIPRSPSPPLMARSMPHRTIWRAIQCTVWSTIYLAPVRVPAPIRLRRVLTCWWI